MLEKFSKLTILQNNNNIEKFKYTVQRILNSSTRRQSTEYMVDKYSEYSRGQDEDSRDSSSKGALYSVSQHVSTVNGNYSNICGGESGYSERNREMSGSEHVEDNSEGFDKKNTDSAKAAPTAGNMNCMNDTQQLHRDRGARGTSGINRQTNCCTLPTCVYFMSHIAVHLDMEDAANATSEQICQAIINCEELGLNRQLAAQMFTLWVYSPLLELQLKPTHKPYEIKKSWKYLLDQYSHASFNRKQRDEIILSFQRNIFFPQHLEEKIKDLKIIELLYEEARYNILEGRYPCEDSHCVMLGGIQARIELGPYNPQVHSTHYFREEQAKFLPAHVRRSPTWTWLPISSKNSAEVRLLEQFKRIPNSATTRKLMRKYLEFCWSLPYYGAAFFEGQIEQPVRGLTSLITHQDIPVLVAINARGVYIIDDTECSLLLSLRYEELSWDHARPSKEDDPNCLPCLFLQFMVLENGARVSKILQVFSKQANLMDKVISAFVHQMKKKTSDETDNPNNHSANIDGSQGQSTTPVSSLSNKLSRLTLATFDEDGRCIGQMGSWSFGY